MPRALYVLSMLCAGLAVANVAQAARPLVADDARIVDKGGCQIESFTKRQTRFHENEFWFLPACNPFGVELTLGGINVRSLPLGDSHTVYMQGKTLLKPLETNGSGFALTLGMLRVGPHSAPGAHSPYFNAIGSFSYLDDRVVVHTNLGGIRDNIANVSRGTWGLGSETQLAPPRWIGILEAYGQRGEKPTLHTGLRIWIVPNRFQIDTTVGFQNSSPDRRFYTIGLRFLWD